MFACTVAGAHALCVHFSLVQTVKAWVRTLSLLRQGVRRITDLPYG